MISKGNWQFKLEQLDAYIYHGLALSQSNILENQIVWVQKIDRLIVKKFKMIDTTIYALWYYGACLKNSCGFHLRGPLSNNISFN